MRVHRLLSDIIELHVVPHNIWLLGHPSPLLIINLAIDLVEHIGLAWIILGGHRSIMLSLSNNLVLSLFLKLSLFLLLLFLVVSKHLGPEALIFFLFLGLLTHRGLANRIIAHTLMIGLELRWSLDFFSLGVLRVLLLFTFIKVFVDWLVLELLSWLRLVWIRLSDA